MPTPALPESRAAFDYAIVRVVPRVERGEFINVGIILFCRTHRFLEAHIALQPQRLQAIAPHLDMPVVQCHLDIIPRICAGDAAAGPIALLPQTERFHWLVNPRSTIIQTSPAHGGLCTDPADTLKRLMATLVYIDA